MNDVESFFEETGEVERDRYGRPMLVPRGMPKSVRAPYARPSSFSDRVDDMRHIHRWEQRGLARAMSLPINQHLRDLAHAEVYTTAYDMGDEGENKASGRRLDEVVYRALDTIGWNKQADRGTAVHKWMEDRDRLWDVPDHLKPFVEGAWRKIDHEGIEILASEVFVACDEVMAAGTFDCLVRHPKHGVVSGDWKTGKLNTGFAVQEAIYSNSEVYDKETDERQPLESLTGGEEVNRDVGLLFDVKAEGTEIYVVDLERAWRVAKAIKVVDTELKMDIMTKAPSATLDQRIIACNSEAAIRELWEQTKSQWGDKHRDLARRRRAELEAHA